MTEMTEDVVGAGPDAINEILNDAAVDPQNMSLETLVLLVNVDRLKFLREKTHSEFTELKKRQGEVRTLHSLLKNINKLVNSSGELDATNSEELKKLLKEAKDLGVETKDGQLKFNKEEKDRLVENIRMTIDDMNVLNDMQLQSVNRLTNERYESYQLARAILKPLHEAKMQTARAVK